MVVVGNILKCYGGYKRGILKSVLTNDQIEEENIVSIFPVQKM